MDQPTPPAGEFLRVLLDKVASTIPATGQETDRQHAEQREFSRAIYAALNPRDAAEAQLAALAIAAGQAAMDNFARAARPNVSNDAAARLRSNAMAANRAYMQALLYFRPQQKAAVQSKPASRPAPAAAPFSFPARPNGQAVRLPVSPPAAAPPQAAMQPPPLPLPPGTGAPVHHSPAARSP